MKVISGRNITLETLRRELEIKQNLIILMVLKNIEDDNNSYKIIILKDNSFGFNYGWVDLFFYRGNDSSYIKNVKDTNTLITFIKEKQQSKKYEFHVFYSRIDALKFMLDFYEKYGDDYI